MDDTHETVLRWPHADAKEVIVSGDFDQWSKSIHLTKDESGFAATVRIPWGAKVEYKFFVDGQWQTSDAPTETDPSGKFVNNVYTAPPKPASSVSAAISYVASGFGGALQSLTGAGATDTEKESEVRPETSTQDLVSAEAPTEPTTPLKALPAANVASTIPVPIVPVTDTARDAPVPSSTVELALSESKAPEHVTTLSTQESTAPRSQQNVSLPELQLEQVTPSELEQGIAPATSQPPEPTITPTIPEHEQSTASSSAAPAAASEPEHITASEPKAEQTSPAVVSTIQEPEKITLVSLEPEASTHAPVSFSKASKAEITHENNTDVNGAAALPTSSAVESAGAVAVDDNAETLAGQSNVSALPPTAPEGSPTLTKGKYTFPGSEKEYGDGISSKTGTSSLRKKQHSIFGGVSEGDGGDTSKHPSSSRKKTRSFFGKLKHMFDKND